MTGLRGLLGLAYRGLVNFGMAEGRGAEVSHLGISSGFGKRNSWTGLACWHLEASKISELEERRGQTKHDMKHVDL